MNSKACKPHDIYQIAFHVTIPLFVMFVNFLQLENFAMDQAIFYDKP